MNYRDVARGCLIRANAMLPSDSEEVLRYAALELRQCLECLIYERAWCYKSLLSADDLKEWQPSRLIKRLLEIAPYADKGVGLTMASKEDENDILMDETERVLSRKELSKHYHKIGSYLHASFNNDLEPIALNTTSVNKSLERLSTLMDEVINSPIAKLVPKAVFLHSTAKSVVSALGVILTIQLVSLICTAQTLSVQLHTKLLLMLLTTSSLTNPIKLAQHAQTKTVLIPFLSGSEI